MFLNVGNGCSMCFLTLFNPISQKLAQGWGGLPGYFFIVL